MIEEKKQITPPENGANGANHAVPAPLPAPADQPQPAAAPAPVDVSAAVKAATAPLSERIASLETALKEREAQVTTMAAEVNKSLAEYRSVIAAANPLVPQDMLTGKTIDELKASAQKANGFIATVRTAVQQQLEAAARSTSVPAGAPARTENTDNLTTREKIQLGLKKARKEN